MFLFSGNVLRRTPILLSKFKNQPEKNTLRSEKPEPNNRRNQ
jgi:hypothetical protein